MAGNVWEWTSSLYQPYPYKPDDGREDPEVEDWRVLRGGSFFYVRHARCAFRNYNDPDSRLDHYGFRVGASPGL